MPTPQTLARHTCHDVRDAQLRKREASVEEEVASSAASRFVLFSMCFTSEARGSRKIRHSSPVPVRLPVKNERKNRKDLGSLFPHLKGGTKPPSNLLTFIQRTQDTRMKRTNTTRSTRGTQFSNKKWALRCLPSRPSQRPSCCEVQLRSVRLSTSLSPTSSGLPTPV